MKRVVTAAVLIPVVLLAVFRAPDWLFTFLCGAVALLAAREYLDIVDAHGFKPHRTMAYGLITLSFVAMAAQGLGGFFFRWSSAWFMVYMGGALLMLLVALGRDDPRGVLPTAALSWIALPYTALPLALCVVMRRLPAGEEFLLILLVVVWVGDIAAYYVGKHLGRHRMAPRTSPNKTWEGAFASLVASMVVGGLMLRLFGVIRTEFGGLRASAWPAALLVVLAINVSAQLGDLVESAMKRGASLKDSGTIVPGHGGVLDRIDALLFAAPVGFVLFILTFHDYF
ncbi:MAG: phosphatidate cytidylyltransferase [Terriglobales bacterium]